MPCNATELVHFRKRIGVKGFNQQIKIDKLFLDGICYVQMMVHTYKGRLNNVFLVKMTLENK
jgi:hypothetical protein